MKILITGADGMLGSDLRRSLSELGHVIGKDIHDFDITDEHECRQAVLDIQPDVVVHAAAYTRVDDCESNQALAFRVNAHGTKNIASACRQAKALLVY